jgi:hypothetical protein
MDDKEDLAALKGGLGPTLAVTDVTASGKDDGKSVLTISDSSNPAVRGDLNALVRLCTAGTAARAALNAERQAKGLQALRTIKLTNAEAASISGSRPLNAGLGSIGPVQPRLLFRSVGSVIQYLGESHRVRFRQGASDSRGLTYINRDNKDQTLFRIDWGLDDEPDVVSTTFQGTTFRVPRLDLRRGEDGNRTLKAFSFLDQLIALQTSESTIRGTQPVLTISQ